MTLRDSTCIAIEDHVETGSSFDVDSHTPRYKGLLQESVAFLMLIVEDPSSGGAATRGTNNTLLSIPTIEFRVSRRSMMGRAFRRAIA